MEKINPLSEHLASSEYKPADSERMVWFAPDSYYIKAIKRHYANGYKKARGLTILEYARELKH